MKTFSDVMCVLAVINDFFSFHRGSTTVKKSVISRQKLSHFHRFNSRVLLGSYPFDLPLQNG